MTKFFSSLIDVEELNDEQVAEKIKQIARENQINLEDIEFFYASGMPEEIQGMTRRHSRRCHWACCHKKLFDTDFR